MVAGQREHPDVPSSGDWKVRDAESGERACSADRREGEDVSSDPQCSWEKYWGMRWGRGGSSLEMAS